MLTTVIAREGEMKDKLPQGIKMPLKDGVFDDGEEGNANGLTTHLVQDPLSNPDQDATTPIPTLPTTPLRGIGMQEETVTLNQDNITGRSLRILMATEYLPPFVSGIANRCKNLIKGYRASGHTVTVFSVTGSNCDHALWSFANPFYEHQRMFAFPSLFLLGQLLNPFQPVPYDVVHVVTPLCLAFLPLLPLFYLRNVRIYVSYHVYLQYYRNVYFYPIVGWAISWVYILLYFIPLVWFADAVGIPSETADYVVYKYSKRVHFLKSGLDTKVFCPLEAVNGGNADDHASSNLTISTNDTPPSWSHGQIRGILSPRPVLIYVGRLAGEKNIEFLVDAMAHSALKDFALVIVGDGPSRDSLVQLAVTLVGEDQVERQMDLSQLHESAFSPTPQAKRIIFTGMVVDELTVARLYASADIFVSASASETFGFTVAEALSCATPAVIVNSGAFQTVYHMIRDWMFEEEDLERYVSCVTTVMSTLSEARVRSRQLATQEFSIEASVKDVLKAYGYIVDISRKPKFPQVVNSEKPESKKLV